MFVVDTNILVYASNRDAPSHAACRAWLDAQRRSPDAWFLTWGIVYDFLRVITHPRVLAKPWSGPRAWRFIEALLAAPGLVMLIETDRHAEIIAALLSEFAHLSGNLWHDVHTAALMREHGVRRIATRDTDFHRFTFLEPFDPAP